MDYLWNDSDLSMVKAQCGMDYSNHCTRSCELEVLFLHPNKCFTGWEAWIIWSTYYQNHSLFYSVVGLSCFNNSF